MQEELTKAELIRRIIALENELNEVQGTLRDLQRLQEETEVANRELMDFNEQLGETITRSNALAMEAEISNIAKSEFLSNLNIEMSGPINTVVGFSEVLLNTELDNKQIGYVESVKQSGVDLLALLNEALDFSKLEKGDTEMQAIDFDPEILIYDIYRLMLPRIRSKGLDFECRVGDHVPARVVGDPLRFKQVIIHLVGNAVKFTDEGSIEIVLNVARKKGKRMILHVAVRDTGPGVPNIDLADIFEPDKPYDGGITRQQLGTGFGLSICRRMAKLMKGDLWAESKDNRGSRFHLTAAFDEADVHKSKRYTPTSLNEKRVLIGGDEAESESMLRCLLESVGMRVSVRTKAEEVVPELKNALDDQDSFDLCVLAVDAKGLRMKETMAAIRAEPPPLGSLPVLAVSAHTTRVARQCLEAGFNGFLGKPFEGEILLRMLARLLEEPAEPDSGDAGPYRRIITQYSLREELKHTVCILLLDQGSGYANHAKFVLTRGGYEVDVAGGGPEDLERQLLLPEEYDLVITDLFPNVEEGITKVKAVREEGFSEIPIFAAAENIDKGIEETCSEAGITGCLKSPVTRREVYRIVENWVLHKIP